MLPLKKFDKNGAIWCILSVSELVIIDLKTNTFGENKSTTQILCHIFSKINPDAHFGTKINTFTYYQMGRGWGRGRGAAAHRSQRNVKNGGLTFFTSNITYQMSR